jgi:UDPglucose 6-dehydrogenase
MLATDLLQTNRQCNDALAPTSSTCARASADPRIGSRFLYPGVGVRRLVFSKDVKACTATQLGRPLRIMNAVEAANERRRSALSKIVARLGDDLTGRTFAVWGLAFKANTGDMREAPSRNHRGTRRARRRHRRHDPVAMAEAKHICGEELVELRRHRWTRSRLPTRWSWSPNEGAAAPISTRSGAALKHPLVFDGRNLYDPDLVRAARIEYFSIGHSGLVRPTSGTFLLSAHLTHGQPRRPLLDLARPRRETRVLSPAT